MATSADNPIKTGEDDRLHRRGGAISIATEIRQTNATEGFVLGIVGPWGSGKTSVINMVRECLGEEPALITIDFNPWAFSGTNELIHAFFRELSAQLKLKGQKLGDIAETIDSYGDLLTPIELLPVLGDWFARFRNASKAMAELQKKRSGSFAEQRNRVAEKLRALDSSIVVIIDDIDRLESVEIRDIFKLVRLTASFPNIVYVLAFDRQRVEEALSQSGFDGRAYLEKIIQLGVEIPAVPEGVMLRQIGTSLEEALADLEVPERFNPDVWPDILAEVVRPLIKNMRDVKRYALAVRAKTRTLGGQVELVDIMGLEAVRLFLPAVFDAIVAGRRGLTSPGSEWSDGRYEDPSLKRDVDRIMDSDTNGSDVVTALIERMFPAALRHIQNSNYGSSWLKTWLKARRVAHPEVLAVYLEHVANDSMIAFGRAEDAFAVLSEEAALDALLRSYDLGTLQDVISSLEAFEDDYPREAVIPASRVLLNLLPMLPERPAGMLSLGDTRLVVTRVLLRLFRRIEEPGEAMVAVEAIMSSVRSLSAQLELLMMVGYWEGAGHKLVSEADAKALEDAFRSRLIGASPSQLAREQDLLGLLCSPKHSGAEAVTVDPAQHELCAAVLLAAQTEVRSQTPGTRNVRRAARLQWDALVAVFDGEAKLKAATDGVRDGADAELASVIDLVDKYLSGWRPTEWGAD